MKISVILLAVLVSSAGIGLRKADSKAPSKVSTEKDMGADLLAYFTYETHGLYMVLSHDGYSFTDINSGKQIMDGRWPRRGEVRPF